ncbi:hypothetical protein C0J52_10725 [Blattella germanica]|nr:hypothetical protein C0J52_10725 [Blattella germanica]
MTKVRKQKRMKKFRYNVNRKKLRNKNRKVPKIQCSQIKESWEESKSTEQNIANMGLSYDVNQTFKIPSAKAVNLDGQEDMECDVKSIPTKKHVAEEIEADARAPRVKKFRLPNNQVRWLSYLMDKHGEDYKAMARDTKNYYQDTWKQIRAKINRFKSIPEQYDEYLKSKMDQESTDPLPEATDTISDSTA